MALDLDSQLFRRLRLPQQVFPLNAVIDAEGNLAYLGADLDAAVAIIETLLPG